MMMNADDILDVSVETITFSTFLLLGRGSLCRSLHCLQI